MIPKEAHIPVLLAEIRDKYGIEKTASLVDAIIGAPVGAVAARLSVGEKNKDKATKRGLIMGALLGFLAGQESVKKAIRGSPTPIYQYPIVASAAGGLGAGLYTRKYPPKEEEEEADEAEPIVFDPEEYFNRA